MLTLLLILIFIVCFGFLFREGIWSNTLRLINVIAAALLATNYFEPVADLMQKSGDWFASFTYVWDFLALWAVFAFFMAVFRGATEFVSKVKVRFRKLHDQIGSPILAACIGWVMICFTTMTLHTAPLGRSFMLDFQPEKRMFLGLEPDHRWLAFVQNFSLGSFCRTATGEELSKQEYGVRDEDQQWERTLCVFDRNAEFMPKYATRRALLEAHMSKPGTKSIKVSVEDK